METIVVTEEKCKRCLYGYPCTMWDELSLPEYGETCDNYVEFEDNDTIKAAIDSTNSVDLSIDADLEKKVRQIIDLFIEAGKHYNGVVKKEREANGYSDLLINMLDGTVDAKELGIQYVLDKLKAKKNRV